MSAQDPIGSISTDPPKNPTHFGGDGLYESSGDTPQTAHPSDDDSLKIPLSKHLDSADRRSLAGEPLAADQGAQDSVWSFAKRNHLPAVIAIGGLAWLLISLIRRSTERW